MTIVMVGEVPPISTFPAPSWVWPAATVILMTPSPVHPPIVTVGVLVLALLRVFVEHETEPETVVIVTSPSSRE